MSESQPPAGPPRNPGPPPPPAPPARYAPPPPQYAPPPQQYRPPQSYAPPQPPAGYPGAPAAPAAAPYAAPYTAPRHPQFASAVTATEAPRGPKLGIVALLAALAAAVVAPLAVAIAGFRIGMGVGTDIAMQPIDADWNWRVLTPVRDWVLLGELSFWAGTALGVWAIVQGIIAIAARRGRGAGIAAVVIAVLGFFAWVVTAWLMIVAGIASGSSVGG